MDCDEEYPFFCGYGWGCDGECDASKCCQKGEKWRIDACVTMYHASAATTRYA